MEQLRSCLESVRCEISIETKDLSIKDLINAQNIFSYLRPSTNYSILSPYRIIPMENYKRFISSKDHQTILWLDNRKQLNWIDSKYENHLLTRKSNENKRRKTSILCFPRLVPLISPNLVASTTSNLLPMNQNAMKDFDIVDFKWCSIHQIFFILFQRHLFSFDPKTLTFQQIHLPRHKDYP